MKTNTKKTVLILIPLIALVLIVGIGTHMYSFPSWTREVEELAISYLSSQEEIVETYGEDARFSMKGMQYNTETKNSTVKIQVNDDLYQVKVDCVENVFTVRGYEKIE